VNSGIETTRCEVSKYVIAWPHRIGDLYFRRIRYTYVSDAKIIDRTANLSEALLFDSYRTAQDYFDVEIAPDTTANIQEVTDKDLFHAKLADDPAASKDNHGTSS
jgi:hypothetical protein